MIKVDWKIIGHQAILKFLEKGLINQKVAQTYLFCGPKNVGKTAVAKQLINFLICENYQKYQLANDIDLNLNLGCGQCSICRQYQKGIYADLYLLERQIDPKTEKHKKNITINQIRELHDSLSRHAFGNSYKIVLIPEAESLSEEASNGLLKILEEPTPKTVFILITTTKDFILPTVLSRSQIINFTSVSRSEIYDFLLTRGATRTVAKELAAVACGRPTRALDFFDDREKFSRYKEEMKKINLILGASNFEKSRFIDSNFDKKATKESFLDFFGKLELLVRDWQFVTFHCEDLISQIYLLDEIKNKVDIGYANQLLEKTVMAKDLIRKNLQPKLVLENVLLN
jgi:DNA polymerase-3 subunit delta'